MAPCCICGHREPGKASPGERFPFRISLCRFTYHFARACVGRVVFRVDCLLWKKALTFKAVTKGLTILLALVIGLYASAGCRIPQASAAIEAPCCGTNCSMPSAGNARACCQSGGASVTQEVPGRPAVPSLAAVAVAVVPPTIWLSCGTEAASSQPESAWDPPPTTNSLALLCSRQI
jgi:hypothetical protein